MAINWNKRKYTKEEFIEAWMTSESIAECSRKLGLGYLGHHKAHEMTARFLGLSKDHMRVKDKDSTGRRSRRPLEELLVEDSDYTNSSGLRKRLINEGIFEPICSGCKRDTWINFLTGEEEPMNLTLDHINGINYDNRIENLRILCPTCHSYTPTYCGKNKSNNQNRPNFSKCDCGKRILAISKACIDCHNKKLNSKLAGITVEQAIEGVENYGYASFGKMLNVSDNAVRKFLSKNGVNPLPKKRRSS
jgi:hypothetical protein